MIKDGVESVGYIYMRCAKLKFLPTYKLSLLFLVVFLTLSE